MHVVGEVHGEHTPVSVRSHHSHGVELYYYLPQLRPAPRTARRPKPVSGRPQSSSSAGRQMSLAGGVYVNVHAGTESRQYVDDLPSFSSNMPVTASHLSTARQRPPPAQPHTMLAHKRRSARPRSARTAPTKFPPSASGYAYLPVPPMQPPTMRAPPTRRPTVTQLLTSPLHANAGASSSPLAAPMARRPPPRPPRPPPAKYGMDVMHGVEVSAALVAEASRGIERRSLAAAAFAPDPTMPIDRPGASPSTRRHQPPQPPGTCYPTVLQLAKRGTRGRTDARPVGSKTPMSQNEMLYYLRHGVKPLPSGRSHAGAAAADAIAAAGVSPSPMQVGADAALESESRRAVLRAVHARETALRSVYSSLPRPSDESSLRAMTHRLLTDARMAHGHRVQLSESLHALRVTSAAAVHAIATWRDGLRARAAHAPPPAHELPFLFHGVDYLHKMANDTAFLPAPTHSDPLLLDWFDEAMPWLLDPAGGLDLLAQGGVGSGDDDAPASGAPHTARTPRAATSRPSSAGVRFLEPSEPMTSPASAPPPTARPASADATRPTVSTSFADAARELAPLFAPHLADADEADALRQAQAALLSEANHRGDDVSALAAVQAARRTALGQTTRAAAWRWAAFQMILYGCECYLVLVAGLPKAPPSACGDEEQPRAATSPRVDGDEYAAVNYGE